MANIFDVFDEEPPAETGANPFDKFSPEQKPAMEHQTYQRIHPVQKTGNVLDLLRGVPSGIADLLRGAEQRAVEVGTAVGAVPPFVKSRLYNEEAARRENREFNPDVTKAEKVGRVASMFAGTIPFAAAPGGQTAVGSTLMSLLAGGAGASLFPTTSGTEALANTGLGAVGMGAGNLASRAILPTTARTMTQAQKDILTASNAEGIPLRTSEATGSNVIKNWEQMRANRPITGGMEQRFNKIQTEAINKAFTRRLGKEVPEVNDELLKTFRDEIGGRVSAMAKGRDVPLDTEFLNSLIAVDTKASVGGKLTYSPQIKKTVDDALDLITERQSIKGETAQEIRSLLMDKARDARSADNNELANALEQIVDGLKKAMTGTMTASEKEAWAAANRQYANYKLVEEAFKRDPQSLALGDVPINKMARVMEKNRPLSYLHGKGDFADLAKLGQVIRPPGRSALLGETSLPVVRNAMDVAHAAVYPAIQSRLMQRYLTGSSPGQMMIRDTPGGASTLDALLRAAGLNKALEPEYQK